MPEPFDFVPFVRSLVRSSGRRAKISPETWPIDAKRPDFGVWSRGYFDKFGRAGREQRGLHVRVLILGALAGALLAVSALFTSRARPVVSSSQPGSGLSKANPAGGDGSAAAPAVSARAPELEARPSAPLARAVATPLDDLGAAEHLAKAYAWLLGAPPSERSLSILWAHWAHETKRGQRMQGYNFAGLKGTGPDGDRILTWTREAAPTERFVKRSFRAYSDEVSGARDYLALLGERYPLALSALRRGHENDFVAGLASGGYFTDDPALYLRAVTRLAAECRRRKLPARALRAPKGISAEAAEDASLERTASNSVSPG